MPRYIDADALYEEFKNGISDTEQEKVFNQVGRYLVRHAPTADVVPVVRGEWVKEKENMPCSNCGLGGVDYWNYCPNCGARMEDKQCE